MNRKGQAAGERQSSGPPCRNLQGAATVTLAPLREKVKTEGPAAVQCCRPGPSPPRSTGAGTIAAALRTDQSPCGSASGSARIERQGFAARRTALHFTFENVCCATLRVHSSVAASWLEKRRHSVTGMWSAPLLPIRACVIHQNVVTGGRDARCRRRNRDRGYCHRLCDGAALAS